MNKRERKRGRPATNHALGCQYRLRMSDDMDRRLNNLSRMTGISKADIFREAFNTYEKLKLFQHSDSNSESEYEEYCDYFDEENDDLLDTH